MKKGSATRNIGQSNMYSFHSLIALAFYHFSQNVLGVTQKFKFTGAKGRESLLSKQGFEKFSGPSVHANKLNGNKGLSYID